jgi:hypothetical protein
MNVIIRMIIANMEQNLSVFENYELNLKSVIWISETTTKTKQLF